MLVPSLWKRFGSKSQMPGVKVNFAFSLRHPNSRQIQWKQIDILNWHVSFRSKGIINWSLYTSEGNWLETTCAVNLKDIPLRVQENYGSKYGIKELQHVYKIQMAQRTIYEVHWGNGIYDVKLLYDESGQIIGKMLS